MGWFPLDYKRKHLCARIMQDGYTSLMLATQRGHVDIVKALLDAKADPNITDKVSINILSTVYFYF